MRSIDRMSTSKDSPTTVYRVWLLLPGHLTSSGRDTWVPVSASFPSRLAAATWSASLSGESRVDAEDE
jgi:hypothetical protein